MAEDKGEKSKSRVKAYILGDGKVIPSDALERYAVKRKGEAKSRALPKTEIMKLGRQGIVLPPANLSILVNLLDTNTWHSKAVRAKARDTIGHGWTLESELNDEGEVKGSEANREKLYEFFKSASVTLGETLEDVLNKVLIDFESTGNAYLEIIREDKNQGEPTALAHVYADTIWPHEDGKRFLQRVDQKSVWFKRAGLPETVNKDTGDISDVTEFNLRATELIQWKEYTPRSEFYGLPQVYPALGAILGDMNQRDYNISFFENNAIPQYAVVIENGELDPETEAVIHDFFENKAKGNPHSTLVMSLPPAEPGQKDPPKITFEKLAVDVREGHFRLYRQDVRNEILAAHSVPPYRLGLAELGSLGSTNIKVANEIYKFQEVDSRRSMLEAKINLFVVQQGFKITDWTWRLNEMDISDRSEDVDYYQKLEDAAFITPNEGREALGWDRSDDPAMDQHYLNGAPIAKLAMDTQEEARGIVEQVAAQKREKKNGNHQ
ncbi:MAG: phage portal protein [Dehalococcoidia bacterium]|nr:phage portal protein [Dehalococcoidia bacterium]